MDQPAWKYHSTTSYDRSKMGGHFLDWENQPDLFKTYANRELLEMPKEIPLPKEDLFTLYDHPSAKETPKATMDLADLSRILLLTYTLTSQARHSNGTFYYRSAASAGALYPTEIYVASEGMLDLTPGLYHFSIARHGLTRLRNGCLSSVVESAIIGTETLPSPLSFFLTAIFFRSAWKYRARAYRYHLLDTGHVLENLILSLKAGGFPFEIRFDFDDRQINYMLGLDETSEVALAAIQVGVPLSNIEQPGRDVFQDLPEVVKSASRVASRETDYPEIRAIHMAGYIPTPPETTSPDMLKTLGLEPKTWESIPLESCPGETTPYPGAVFRRRSRRNFIGEPMPLSVFHSILNVLCAKEPVTQTSYDHSLCLGFLTGQIESLDSGLYLLDREGGAIGLVRPGNFLDQMSHACLDQGWLAGAALHFLFITDMEVLDRTWGARGYRYAMMMAGRMGERLYLAASSLGLGCCGIGAFYDREVVELLNLSSGSRVLYVVAVGPVKALRGKGS
ncbi:MAG: SagB/ThcOx family dehydrogenase [Deltaproteobacteria bacterium]|nr:SagB/ThcOx family dehydrogenase [Deltaproteobacteria bacterium]